jgi:hypothetical protein
LAVCPAGAPVNSITSIFPLQNGNEREYVETLYYLDDYGTIAEIGATNLFL